MWRIPAGLLLLVLPTATSAQGSPPHPHCTADLDSLEAVVRRDYAGFQAKAAANAAALAALTDSVRAAAGTAADPGSCTTTLQRWVAFFGDPHLQLWEPQATPGGAGEGSRAGPSADPGRPSLSFADDSTAVLRLPSFGDRYKPAIDSLVSSHRARLLATLFLVLDVRDNGGGWTQSYGSILPLLYTGPIHVHGMEAWASEGNIAYLREILDSDRAEGIKAAIRALLPRMEANRNRFVAIGDDREIRLDTVYPMPRSVAVLVGRRCASTCEQFVLDARQSRKVTILGAENTGGFLDYGNVRRVRLPSGVRVFQVPTSRSRRLPANPLDRVGIAPGVRIPDHETDPLGFTLRYLRSGTPRGDTARTRPR